MKRMLRGIMVVGLLGGLTLGALAADLGSPASGWAAPAQRVDLNTASVDELTALPGIGPAKAKAIAEYRAKQRFSTAEELMQVQGVGAKLFEQLKDRVTVGSAEASGNPATKVR